MKSNRRLFWGDLDPFRDISSIVYTYKYNLFCGLIGYWKEKN